MDHCHFPDQIFYLIALQMSDHMPADVFWKLVVFIAQLLHLIFPEIADSCVVGFLQGGKRFCLADCNQKDVIGGSPGFFRGFCDIVLCLF